MRLPGSRDAAPVKKLSNPDPMPRRGFNVVLLLGDMQDASGQDTIPNAARKALADMKDFLPYKGYRLLDTQWVLASTSGPAITRLRGVDDQEYELELRASPAFASSDGRGAPPHTPAGLSVRFVLREPNDGAGVASGEGGRTPLHPKELAKGESSHSRSAARSFSSNASATISSRGLERPEEGRGRNGEPRRGQAPRDAARGRDAADSGSEAVAAATSSKAAAAR